MQIVFGKAAVPQQQTTSSLGQDYCGFQFPLPSPTSSSTLSPQLHTGPNSQSARGANVVES